jgi:hypothetical protein
VKTTKLLGLLVLSMFFLSTVSTTAQASGNCRSSSLGNDLFGKKFRCSDGTTITIKPNLSGSYTDPLSPYRATDNKGNNFRCRYDSLMQRYKCR